MNEPIRFLGIDNGKKVYYLNGEQINLQKGFTPSCVYLGQKKTASGKMEHQFFPNRSDRRKPLQKENNKPGFGKMIKRIQVTTDKEGNRKRVAHWL